MIKKLTCIDCPKGCGLEVDIENCRVNKVSGNKCPKGEQYAIAEIENPVRILTTTVLSEGLSMKMVPVRIDKPIPKSRMHEAMEEIKKLKISKPQRPGEIVLKHLLGLDVNLIVTRDVC